MIIGILEFGEIRFNANPCFFKKSNACMYANPCFFEKSNACMYADP